MKQIGKGDSFKRERIGDPKKERGGDEQFLKG